ncbi:hypothetical protein [Caudoviricetes sp.]|nr:hypothetical protein [Caudoviricetes sp.]UOF81020.1 hypothetical protein [Caudoviricetes sp.]UOF81416.1 hypothetical protein [Caudoviricetes sp.]
MYTKPPIRIQILWICILSAFFPAIPAFAESSMNAGKLADAIYKAEGGARTSHPYGILIKYKHTTPRQACLNTIASAEIRFKKQSVEKDFIVFLGNTYCPTKGNNLTFDEKRLNVNWVTNVKYFYLKGESNGQKRERTIPN